MIKRFLKVTDGLYRGSAPSVEDVIKLSKFGINKIVSLDRATGERIHKICKHLGMKHVMIPLDGTRASIIELLSHDLKDLLLSNGPTFVHCAQGKDRTGFVVALFKCKYLGTSYEEAMKEALSLGFGVGVDKEFMEPFIKILKTYRDKQDVNNADIVTNTRQYSTDGKDMFLDEARQNSFAPYISTSKQYPYDDPYNDNVNQSPTRENYKSEKEEKPIKEHTSIPMVGQYDNSAGLRGSGPVENYGGFIHD